MKKIIKLIAAALAALMLITGCSTANTPASSASQSAAAPTQQASQAPEATSEPSQTTPVGETQTTGENTGLIGSPWIDSDIKGNLPDAAPDLKDDFHMAVNYDWLKDTQPPANRSNYGKMQVLEDQNIAGLIEYLNAPAQNPSKQEELVRTFFEAVKDTDARNAAGDQPLQKYLQKIKDVKTLDELTALLTDSQNLLTQPFIKESLDVDDADSSKYTLVIEPSPFALDGDADEYQGDGYSENGELMKFLLDDRWSQMLALAGYTEDETAAIIDGYWKLEGQIANGSKGKVTLTNPALIKDKLNKRTEAELQQEAGAFPITQILNSKGYGGLSNYTLYDPGWLKTLGSLYTEKNLDGLKAYLIINTLYNNAQYLSQDYLDLVADIKALSADPDAAAYKLTDEQLGNALGYVFVDRFLSDETKADIQSLIDEMIAAFGERLDDAQWLTDETKAGAKEKLDNIGVFIGEPAKWTDYTGLELKEGDTLIDMVAAIRAFNNKVNSDKLKSDVVRGEWPDMVKPQAVNAFYNPGDNSINVPVGILGGDIYDPNATKEENMGAIGTILGHELTHAFDTTGSQFDKDGNMDNWWTDEDAAAFKTLTDKVSKYYGTMEPLTGMNVNGNLTVGETVADLGGVAVMLEIAEDDPDFNYDEFFKSYAELWSNLTSEATMSILLKDTHAPNYLRVNVDVQQFPEFYETYDIKEGDGMYLAEEDRLSVW